MGGKKEKIPDFLTESDDPETLKEWASKCYMFGKRDKEIGLFRVAIIHLTKAIDLTKENPNHILYANRALVYMEMGLLDECVADCDTTIKMKPDFVKIYWRKAKILETHLRTDEAMAAIQEGLKFDPENEDLKKLEAVVKNDIEYEKICPKDDKDRLNLDALKVWMALGGATFNKVVFRMDKASKDADFVGDENRGVQAAEHIKEGEFVMTVPARLVFNVNLAAQSQLAKEMTTHKIREAIVGDAIGAVQMSVLAAHLLQTKREKAEEWRPYFDSLPTKCDHFPEMMPEEDLKWLEGSSSKSVYEDAKAALQGHHKVFTELCPSFDFTFEEYAWAMKTVESRVVKQEPTPGKCFLCLVPGADLLNHSLQPNCELHFDKEGGAKLLAIRDIPPFAQLRVSYGHRRNVEYLRNWGFTLPMYAKTAVRLPTWLDEKDAHFEAKKKLVDDQVNHDFLVPGGFSTAYNSLLSRMRFYAADDTAWVQEWKNKFLAEWEQQEMHRQVEHVQAIQDGFGTWGGGAARPAPKYGAIDIVTPVSLENELKAWDHLTKFSKAALAKYPQTLEEDVALLKKDAAEKHLNYNQRNCLILRHEEKLILKFLLDAHEIVKKWATMKHSEAGPLIREACAGGQAAQEMGPVEVALRPYLATCVVDQLPKEDVAQG